MTEIVLPWQRRRRERLDGLEPLLRLDKPSVLDLGCHRGLVGYTFAMYGASVVHGCDIEKKSIDVAKALFADVDDCDSDFRVHDLAKGTIPFAKPSYDVVLMLGVYHKLKRQMAGVALEALVDLAVSRTDCFFAWNGVPEEVPIVSYIVDTHDMELLHEHPRDDPEQVTVVWARDPREQMRKIGSYDTDELMKRVHGDDSTARIAMDEHGYRIIRDDK